MTKSTFQKASAEYREHLPDLTSPRFQQAKDQDPYEYVQVFKKEKHPPWLYNLTEAWEQLYQQPFKGITTDGMMTVEV
jgi:hypothetical protein